MRKLLAALLLLLFLVIQPASAKLNSTINTSCPSGFQPLISMAEPNSSSNNVGGPGVFEHQVCVDGLLKAEYSADCSSTTAFYVSSNSTRAHFSNVEGYNLRVCTGNVIASLRSSCQPGEEPLFKVSERISGFGRHVASPAFDGFNTLVCGRFADPQNVSLTAKFNLSGSDEVYFDDRQVGELDTSELAEFPYLVSTDGSNVAGLVSPSYREAERSIEGENVLKLKKSAERSSFLVPLTSGGYREIENDEDEILDGGFLNRVNPAFGPMAGGDPVLRAILEPGTEVDSRLSVGAGSYRVRVENLGDGEIRIEQE